MKPVIKIFLLVSLLFILDSLTLPEAGAQEPASVPVLAFYYAWFDQNTWTSGQSVDLPAQPYTSADQAAIERHVALAQSAGIDALVQSWLGPQVENNQTETNFRTLLDVAQAKGFKAAVDFETTSPFMGNADAVTSALFTLLSTHVQHPAYLRYQGKPVIFFWRQQQFSVDEWAAIRNQVDPNRTTRWIAEGTDIAYQNVFDGHHLYSIAWAESPAAQLTKWGDLVRAYEAENQTDRLWVATAMPGYDDTRLSRSDAFSVPRRNGEYYRETWQAALESQPEMIMITSFNEWPEGTHIEPSARYGNLYLDVTRELVTGLRGSPPAAPPPEQVVPQAASADAEAAQEPPPDGPYIQTENITNVRSGPDTTFDVAGRLAAGSTASVVGQIETGDWWLIDFEAAPDGQGWVAAEVVEFIGDASTVPVVEAPAIPSGDTTELSDNTFVIQIPPGGVNVRSGPGLDFELLGRLDEDLEIPVVAQNDTGEWWQVEYVAGENNLGWVADVVVDFSGDRSSVPVANSASVEESTPIPAQPIIVGSIEATDPVNVRSESSADSVILGGLYPGDTADVLAVSEDGEWWQIDFADAPDQPAWVAAEFVRFAGEKNSIPIFGIGTVTPTPGPTDTPTPTPVSTATPTVTLDQPTEYAPTATSVYQATSDALMESRGTPVPSSESVSEDGGFSFSWSTIPWGILSVLAIAGFLWYQFIYRRNRTR